MDDTSSSIRRSTPNPDNWHRDDQDITLNQETQPGKTFNHDTSINSSILESTIINSQEYRQGIDKEFNHIANNINRTIQELDTIYDVIGYSMTDISSKKAEIFTVIEDSILNFTSSLQREKSNIENECEWLRQQIRIILAMINDSKGEKRLALIQRGLVFNNPGQYEEGYKEEILKKLGQLQNKKTSFYVTSPFNVSGLNDDDEDDTLSYEQQCEYMLKNIPPLSLLQLKSKLNLIFLDILKAFVNLFKKLNELNIKYIANKESIGEFSTSPNHLPLLQSLPSKENAFQHCELIENFELILKRLNLLKSTPNPKIPNRNDDQEAFIISSPRKAKLEASTETKEVPMDDSENGNMNALRDINYQMVRAIRSLKFTKITPEILSIIQQEIEAGNKEVATRSQQIVELTNKCFQYIQILHLTDDQLIQIQKNHEKVPETKSNEGYFDLETLRLIQSDPCQFGLNDAHILYFENFVKALEKVKIAKQKKFDNYVESCQVLWNKLGESADYVEAFLRANSVLTDISLLNFKMELNKLFLKRSEFIDSFISDARIEIEMLWDKMFYSKTQRVEFRFYNYDSNDDTYDKEMVLNEHEEELQKLKSTYKSMEPILSYFDELNELIQDKTFLKESSMDSSRLLSKNSCKILLNEEKIRKKINKNMPRLIKSLKDEVISFNNVALAEGKRPLQFNGEDFFEKLLLIESEQSQSARNSRVGGGVTRSVRSPPKKTVQSARTSPLKSTRSPTTMSAKYSSMPREFTAPGSRKSPLSSGLDHQHPIRKAALPNRNRSERTFNNPTTVKLTNAINTSINSSISSADSPLRNYSNHNYHPKASGFQNTHLQPLSVPLVATSPRRPDIYEDALADSTHSINLSNISKGSPLKTSMGVANSSNILPYKANFSPLNRVIPEMKENDSSPYDFSPVSIQNKTRFFSGGNTETNSTSTLHPNNRRISIATCDTSTFIGDDYQTWRDEKIKQINTLD
ncbi:microtubule associated protein-domain-containing protein [Scheffersomyces coipomensis]|uniref:microtubule associated protein-domain-containing protein n=1 Tax=Scheffersomyces coipomensis TaxID=1788519 RepID=UPI00315D97E1